MPCKTFSNETTKENKYNTCLFCRHINEDKRKTENQVVMFDIMNDIDNCPVSNV